MTSIGVPIGTLDAVGRGPGLMSLTETSVLEETEALIGEVGALESTMIEWSVVTETIVLIEALGGIEGVGLLTDLAERIIQESSDLGAPTEEIEEIDEIEWTIIGIREDL